MTPLLHFERDVFERLLDAAPDAIVVIDGNGTIVFANGQTERLFGHARAELLGQAIEVLVPARFRPTHAGHRNAFMQQPDVRPMGSGRELFAMRKDGSEFQVEISLAPLETPRGLLVSAAIRDISDRKQAEAALRRANQYLMNAVESFQGAFALFDSDERLVMCNSGYRALFGRGVGGQVIGKTHDEIVELFLRSEVLELGDETPAAFAARWREHRKAPLGALEIRTVQGQVVRVIDRRTADGGVVTTTWDITADVQREHELRQARAAAETASSAKSDFLASMSHELRTPLNAVLGFAQLLERDKKTPLTERQLERLGHVLKGGEHLLRLIDEVLDLSRIEAGRIPISTERVHVGAVLEDVKLTLGPMAARVDVTLTAKPGTVRPVIADRTRFAQILMNYGSNAIKYGKKGGTVDFEASERDGMVRVTVIDDGLGIPLEKQDRVFQAFHRAGQEAGPIEGTGIGLAISKKLAEIMGGRVGFASTPGKGSEFWVELPVEDGQEIAMAPLGPERVESPLAAPGEQEHKIVYVEDNPSNIAFMEEFLQDFERITLLVAPTAEIGIELARAHAPDVILMDINLPGMSGFEAVKRLRELPETRSIPVVALSAAAMLRDADRAKEAGFYRYLTKPVRVDELARTLEELLLAR